MRKNIKIRSIPRRISGSEAHLSARDRTLATFTITEGTGGAVAFIEKMIILGLMIFAGGVVLRLVGLFAAAS